MENKRLKYKQMKTFKFIIYLLALFFVFPACTGKREEKFPSVFKIVPQPRKIEMQGGKGLAYGKISGLQMKGLKERPVMGEILSRLPETGFTGPALSLILDPDLKATDNPEGYVLVLDGGGVEIRSTGEAGIFYGCQTLEQLLEDARDFDAVIPACRITDYPALSYRAVHFDVKHHLDHLNYYYESIDRLARYKINAVIFEFEDKLRYVRQPLVGAPQAISIDEMAALTKYAADRHIEISPLVQGLGHATFILKHEQYAPLREIPDKRWVFCPLDSGTYKVLFDMYLDAMDATPGSRYLHIGGDEIGDIGICPRCKPMADKEGVLSLNLYWLNKVSHFIIAHGRTPIFWDDMPLKEAGVYRSTYDVNIDSVQAAKIWQEGESRLGEVVQKLPGNIVFMRWNYSMGRLPGNIMALEWYKKNHFPVMVATAASSSGGLLFPQDERTGKMSDRGLAAIRSFLGLADKKEVGGMLCTAWDDRSPHFETYWRGFIASAAYSWSPSGPSLAAYDEAYLQREYGFTRADYYGIYQKLRQGALFWDRAFFRKGSRSDISNALINLPGLAHWIPEKEKKNQQAKKDFTDVLITLPDPGNPGQWTKLYRKRLDEAAKVMEDYKFTSAVMEDFYARSQRNRYHWQVFRALNDFQVTAPALLLALEQSDVKDEKAREKGMEKVRAAIDLFNERWKALESVYSKTRFISYPDNYVPDRYFHIASQREDLSWMIQPEELFHKMIYKWLDTGSSIH